MWGTVLGRGRFFSFADAAYGECAEEASFQNFRNFNVLGLRPKVAEIAAVKVYLISRIC